MPLQNRVTPWGEIIAVSDRGTLMGNRGCLHDERRHVTKPWARMAWVTCALEFNGRHRVMMSSGQYTELFFLDEATALAAGHRPCATCRRAEYDAFKSLWMTANPELASRSEGKITEIDKLLHAEPVGPLRQRPTWSARLSGLPQGCMVILPGTREPLLLWGGAVHRWAPSGYSRYPKLALDEDVEVLTPSSVVKATGQGYRPVVHRSAVVDSR